MDHPDFGKIDFPHGAIASVFGTRLAPAPKLGEHNEQILGAFGYSPGTEIRTTGDE